jgi:hypothetical protein
MEGRAERGSSSFIRGKWRSSLTVQGHLATQQEYKGINLLLPDDYNERVPDRVSERSLRQGQVCQGVKDQQRHLKSIGRSLFEELTFSQLI